MWSGKPEIWKRYNDDLLAIDSYDALFLGAYIAHVSMHKIDVQATEVMDLQRYKRIRKFNIVKSLLREKRNEPFIFFCMLN